MTTLDAPSADRVVRARALDMQHSQRHSAFVVGPTTLPAPEVLRRRLAGMAAVGPAARIGLEPSASTTSWRHRRPSDTATVVAEQPEDPLDLLPGMPTGPQGIRVVVAGEYLSIRFSHGLGDVALLQTVVDVLLGGIDPHNETNWRRYRSRVSPLLAAGARTFGSDPRRLARLAAFHRRRPLPLAAPPPAVGAVASPSPAAVAAKIPAAEVAALRTRRDARLPRVGMFAIQTVALADALRAAGIPVDPMVTVPFDVRGYLPRRIDTLASFSAGLEFPVGASTDPALLQAAMTEAVQMGRPVANLLVGTAKIRLASAERRSAALAAAWREPTGHTATARLLHSSVGRVPRTDYLKWTDRTRARVLVASDPIGPTGITVTSASVLGGLWFTAAFHDSVFAADRVAHALQTVADRMTALLEA